MLKKLTVFVLLLTLVLAAVPVSAAHYDSQKDKVTISEQVDPITYERYIEVTNAGGTYSVGFAEVIFKKGFLEEDQLPAKFHIRISAVNGVAGIEFEPGVADFCKDVTIRVDGYKGLLYDETSGKNIYVEIKKQQFKVGHFSRYMFS